MLLVVIVLCVGLVGAAPGKQPRDESLNRYLDLVLDNLQVLMVENGLDPVGLPNTSMGFSDVILGIEWHGEAALYNGWMRGMASIYRSDDADFITNSEGAVLGIMAGMGLGDMRAHYTCLAKFMNLGPVADVTADIKGADIYFEALLDTHECKFKAQILEITKLGNISVDIKGLGPLNWILENLIDFLMVFLTGFIREIVETIVKDMTDTALDSIDLSILGPILGCEASAAHVSRGR